MSNASIRVRVAEPAIHCWPYAPERRAYLRNPHRHMFNIEVSTVVLHDERDIEFHDLMDAARERFCNLRDTDPGFVGMSCESMARHLANGLASSYRRGFKVTVWEDWEACAAVSACA